MVGVTEVEVEVAMEVEAVEVMEVEDVVVMKVVRGGGGGVGGAAPRHGRAPPSGRAWRI